MWRSFCLGERFARAKMQSISIIFYLFCLYTVGDSFKIKLDYQKWTFTNGNKSGVARVPGDIFSDLQRNGLISDPYYGDMDLQLRWVPRSNWTYSVNLNLTEDVLDVSFSGDSFKTVLVQTCFLGIWRSRRYCWHLFGRSIVGTSK